MKHQIVLEDFLSNMAVIRTVFETIDMFPPNDPIVAEMQEMIEESRQNLIREITEVCEAIQTNTASLPFPLREFQREMLRGNGKGWDRKRLDNFMKIDAFDADGNSLYYFEPTPIFDRELAAKMSAQEFALLIFNQLLCNTRNPKNYTDKRVFEQTVFQHFLFILFVSYCIKLYPFWQP